MDARNQRNKATARAWWHACDTAPVDDLADTVAAYLLADVPWQGFLPIGTLSGADALTQFYLRPLRQAFPDLERQTHIAMGGVSDGRADGGKDGAYWVGGTGHLTGTQTQARDRLVPDA